MKIDGEKIKSILKEHGVTQDDFWRGMNKFPQWGAKVLNGGLSHTFKTVDDITAALKKLEPDIKATDIIAE